MTIEPPSERPDLIGAELLGNHCVFNVALGLTEFKSPAFYDAVREVREIAHRKSAASSRPAAAPSASRQT